MQVNVFGLTGGIASGKSTVAGFMRARGVGIVDADLVAREVVEPGTEGLSKIVELFGDKLLLADGALDRKMLAEIVFKDEGARRALDDITHPLIRARSADHVMVLAREGKPLIAYEAALLVETGFAEMFRPLVVVAASERVQIERLRARDGVTEEQARARLGSQMPLARKVAAADVVIDSSGTMEQTQQRTDDALRTVCRIKKIDAGKLGL